MTSLNNSPIHCEELRIVQFSDIHFGQCGKDDHRHIHEDVRAKVLEDLETMRSEHGNAHLMIIAGDSAYSGQPSEFKEAAQWIDAACIACGCDAGNVHIVPGNHDIDRKKINGVAVTLHSSIRAANGEQDLNARLGAILSDPDSEQPLLGKLLAYREFAGGWGCDFESAEDAFWTTVSADVGAIDIRILGLNTVLVSDSLDAPGAMILNTSQYVNGTRAAKGEELIVVAHHPLEWLKNRPIVHDYISSRARILIVGHEHKADVRMVNNGSGFERLEIASGAVTAPPGDDFGYSYNWLMLSVQPAAFKHRLRVAVQPRTWVPRLTAFAADNQMFSPNPLPAVFELSLNNVKAAAQRVPSEVTAAGQPLEATLQGQEYERQPSRAAPERATVTDVSGKEAALQLQPQPAPSGDEKDLRRRFWHNLTRLQRLQVLIDLGVISDSAATLTHSIERSAFELLLRDNRLLELSAAIENALNQ